MLPLLFGLGGRVFAKSHASIPEGNDTVKATIVKDRVIGAISYDASKELGGGEGTYVYKGKFESRDVAVKKIFCGSEKKTQELQQEVKILLTCDSHENVVTYFKKEIDSDFIYTALELCDGTLQQWMQNKIE